MRDAMLLLCGFVAGVNLSLMISNLIDAFKKGK